MIDTVIFDIGRVLVRFEWPEYLAGYHFPKETEDVLIRAMFTNPAWLEFDRGASLEETLDRFYKEAPGYEEIIREVFVQYPTCIEQLPHTIPWLTSLKKRGLRLYYLSNYSGIVRDQTQEALSFLPLMDGGLMSYEVRLVKPEPEFYQALFTRYGIVPERAVFIDDNEANLEAARKLGLHTILFREYAGAAAELERLLPA